MTSHPFWHVRKDFLTAKPAQIIEQFWTDDELNRRRSLSTFIAELELVDTGLSLYMEPIQAVFKEHTKLEGNQGLRASVAMLIHAFNSFLSWRHLLAHGYLTEGRLFARNIHEALSRALAFANDLSLAAKFYQGRQIQPTEIQRALSSILATEDIERREVYKRFSNQYRRLNDRSHPTLNSFSYRTAAQEPGVPGLQKAVPEDVLFGGFLSDDLGRIAWLGLTRDISHSLATVGHVIRETTGGWNNSYQEYRETVERQIAEHEAQLDQLYPK
ncbi:MAG: hypothetical protein IIB31_02580 [Chloroflexi bacterium]|nr:hypothetical protein [Chloroflexota bacterium]